MATQYKSTNVGFHMNYVGLLTPLENIVPCAKYSYYSFSLSLCTAFGQGM